jgi:Ca2+-binding RTX toxin-like protein
VGGIIYHELFPDCPLIVKLLAAPFQLSGKEGIMLYQSSQHLRIPYKGHISYFLHLFMITKTPRLTILMVAMMTVLGTGGPIAAFATAYGGNNDGDLIDTDRIIEKTRTDVDRITQDLLNETQDLVDGVITGLPITTTPPPTSSSPPPQCFGQYSTIVGTSGDDTIDGTDGPDVISGLGGDDAIYGYGGDDRICGNDGNDAILGYAGDEYISGGADDDWLDGDNDAFITTGGSDYLNGGDGDDQLFGRGGDDILDSRDDVVNNDKLDGGEGDDGCRVDPDQNVGCDYFYPS